MNSLADYLSRHLLRKIAIRYRLIGALVMLSLLPLLIAGSISYLESIRAVTERTRVLTTEVVKQVAKNIQLEMAKMASDSEALVLSDRIQGALEHYAGTSETDKAAARNDLTRVLLEHYGSFDFINQKYFLDQNNRIMDAQVFSVLGRGVVAFVERAPKLLGRPYWGVYDNVDGQKSLVLLRAVHNKANNQRVGNLFLGFRPTHFSSIFEDVDLGAGTDLFVVDGIDGAVVIRAPDRNSDAVTHADPQLLTELQDSMRQHQRTGFFQFGGGQGTQHLAAYAQIPDTSWFVISTIPADKLATEARAVREQSVVIGFLCFVLSIVLAVVIARSISQPLEALIERMRQAQAGDYRQRVPPEGADELTVLTHQFNEMASQIDQHNVQLEERVRERTRDLADANDKLASLSLTDGLTGIANRRRFDHAIEFEVNRAGRAGSPLALLMIDVDFFKNYNDHYGHQAGDDCLRQIAALLQTHARRASDLAARYGGEEFVLLAADTSLDLAHTMAESIRGAVEALHKPHEASPLGCVTCSIGVAALSPQESTSADLFIELADQAMYRAKEQGRNQVVLARPGTATTSSTSSESPP